MEILGELNEPFLSVIIENAPVLPYWEVVAVYNENSEAVQSDAQKREGERDRGLSSTILQ